MTVKLKPFDLQAALKGEPVMLRNGNKAFVRHHETEIMVGDHWQIWGVRMIKDGSIELVAWAKDGCYGMDGDVSGLDIVGMYPKTHIINGFEVPAPVVEEPNEGDMYFTANILEAEFYEEERWSVGSYDLRLLERGLVFLNKEDAIANAKAMLGINPYEEYKE